MSSSTPEAQALELFRAGRLAEAEVAWRAVLARKPDDPEALHMLGYILARTGRSKEGLHLLGRSIERAPKSAAFLSNRAQVLAEAGRLDDAIVDLRRAVQAEPRFSAGFAHLGNLLRRAGRLDEALAAYRRAIAIDGRNALALYNLGVLLLDARRHGDAEPLFRRVLEVEPANAMAMNNLGVALRETGRAPEALAQFVAACAADPGNAEAANNLGLALQQVERLDEAIAQYERAARLRPAFAAALLNWGNALKDCGDLERASEAYARALAAQPDSADALNNAASVALDRGAIDEARNLYRRAAELRPEWAEPQFGLGQAALHARDFENGWRGYERRFDTRPPQATRRAFDVPRLTLESLSRAKRVAVWSEQGVGDQILYSTLLPELERRGIAAVVEVDARLVAMYRRSLPALEFTTPEDSARAFMNCDHEIPIGSLPGLFRRDWASLSSQPAALLQPDALRVEDFRRQLRPGPWIAISWRSLQKGDRRALAKRKSIDLENFARLAETSGARLLDLQYGNVDEERAAFGQRHPGVLTRLENLDAYVDLEGVVAALAACDRVVTTSNVTAHLAGAIGAPTQLVYLGPSPHFAYWAAEPGGHSLWYPSVEIISNPPWCRPE